MKKLLFLIALLYLVQYAYSQNKEETITKWKNKGYILTEVAKDFYKVETKWGTVLSYFDLSEPKESIKTQTTDSTIIYPFEIDTALYSYKYKLWKEVDVSTYVPQDPIIITDANNNGLPEIYGTQHGPDTLMARCVLYEMDTLQNFVLRHIYSPEPYHYTNAIAIGDLNEDNIKELGIYSGLLSPSHLKFYTGDSINSLPIKPYFISNYLNGQINICRILDIDKNGRMDLLAIGETWWRIFILEYNPIINNFDSVFTFCAQTGIAGYAIGDFDLDGRIDITFGGSDGRVYVIENISERNYEVVWQMELPSRNAGYHFKTNDFNKNGKPEFWVGTQHFRGNGPPLNIYWCFENNGNNSYEVIYKIIFVDVFSFVSGYAFAADINNDGEEELIICAGESFVIILKYRKEGESYIFAPFYYNLARDGYFSVQVYDFDNDGKLELTISMDRWRRPPSAPWTLTRIYKENFLSTVVDDKNNLPGNFEISYSYPNPFNNKTRFKILVPPNIKDKNFVVKVYNLVGEEIKVLLNNELTYGEHLIEWDGKHQNGYDLASGLYFVEVTNSIHNKTLKVVLIK